LKRAASLDCELQKTLSAIATLRYVPPPEDDDEMAEALFLLVGPNELLGGQYVLERRGRTVDEIQYRNTTNSRSVLSWRTPTDEPTCMTRATCCLSWLYCLSSRQVASRQVWLRALVEHVLEKDVGLSRAQLLELLDTPTWCVSYQGATGPAFAWMLPRGAQSNVGSRGMCGKGLTLGNTKTLGLR